MQKCSQVFVEFTNYRQKQEVRVCENYGHPPKTSLVSNSSDGREIDIKGHF